jgi:hypothetical protein
MDALELGRFEVVWRPFGVNLIRHLLNKYVRE